MFTPERRRLPTSIASEAAVSVAELAERVRAASAARTPLRIVGGDTKGFYGRATGGEPLDISRYCGVIDYEPSELVITARAGTRIDEVEALLTQRGQRLAFEPPVLGASSTLGGVVAAGFAGLHKFGVPGIQYLLPVALWIVAVGSLVTLVQRVVTVRRESAEAEARAAAAEQESGAAK